MKLTSEMVKAKAAELGIDCIAIGNIERFRGAPKLMSPLTYFPEARSVIAVAMRIPRGTYRGIEEGTHWHNYTFYSYNKLNSLFRPKKSYDLCCFIEDHGWEAVAHYPAVPEGNGTTREPVAADKVPPDVVCSVRVIAAGCGLGEIGFSKVFLTKKFGPRVRLGLIFTDCELEPDPILDTGEICLHCGACQRECPGNAVPSVKDAERRLTVDFGEKKVWFGDVQMGRCTLSHHGFNNECSPFHKKEFPNMAFDVRHTDMTEEEAYILCYSLANAKWGRKPGQRRGDGVLQLYPQPHRLLRHLRRARLYPRVYGYAREIRPHREPLPQPLLQKGELAAAEQARDGFARGQPLPRGVSGREVSRHPRGRIRKARRRIRLGRMGF